MYSMIDIETIGTAPESVIISVGAVNFNKEGIISKKLWILERDPQYKSGRTEDIDTLKWWSEQSKEARSVFDITEGLTHPSLFCEQLKDFWADGLMEVGEGFGDLRPVGNGADFDITLIAHLITMYHGRKAIPWKFWNVWCFRTLNHLYKLKDKVQRRGNHHDALDDAVYQTECMLQMWKPKKSSPPWDTTK